MKQNRHILLPALSALTCLAFSTRGDAPSFHPTEGTVLKKHIEVTSEITLDEMTMVMGGQDMGAAMGMEMTTIATQVIAITDTYVAVDEDRPTVLERRFDELSSTTEVEMSNAMAPDVEQEMTGSSELEGLTVVFTWDEDGGGYSVEFGEESDGDDELLEGLTEAMDLRGMLPDGEVSEGDTWDIDPDVLLEVLAPCGSVKIRPEELAGMMDMNTPQPSPAEMLGEFEGDVTAEFEGLRDEDGTRVAVIKLTIDVDTAKDMTEFMEEMMSEMEMPEGMDIDMDIESMDMEFEFQGEGHLLWNLESGLVYSLQIDGNVKQAMDTAMSMSMGGTEQSIEQSMSFSGSQSVTLTTE